MKLRLYCYTQNLEPLQVSSEVRALALIEARSDFNLKNELMIWQKILTFWNNLTDNSLFREGDTTLAEKWSGENFWSIWSTGITDKTEKTDQLEKGIFV